MPVRDTIGRWQAHPAGASPCQTYWPTPHHTTPHHTTPHHTTPHHTTPHHTQG
ncbi:MAG: hypothetical protein ABIN80_01205 [Dyadobacter sp.]|uniref:hypothetical protein n=1 Tax=Dyadobacter sp. TaxID=1914288 RepID=UPI003265B195